MTKKTFDEYCQKGILPKEAHIILQALYHDAQGDWEAAHDIAQSKEGVQEYDRLHAYLHRKEGDTWNANYWYRRAKTTMPNTSLEEEWTYLAAQYLTDNG
jgi:hypothetical protein